MSYCFVVAVINVCTPRLRRNKQSVKKEKDKVALSQSSKVYNSLSAKNLQQQPEVGSSFAEPKDIVQRFAGRQIDAGKSYRNFLLHCISGSS